MKLTLALVLTGFVFAPGLFAKARLGEYYLGFAYSLADGGKSADDREGDFLHLRASNPFDSSSDLSIYFDYGSLNTKSGDTTSWNLGVDYITHFNGFNIGSTELNPYLGVGLGFLDEEGPIRLAEDGFTWSLLLGAELQVTHSLSFNFGGRFLGAWSEFKQNEFSTDFGVTWWFDQIHGASFQYQRAIEAELNYFSLEYLYSWQ